MTRLAALLLVFCVSVVNLLAERPPNILWIYVDDMSDWLGCYGYELAESPHIDALAASGIRFENAFMPSPVCSTTRSALITGAMQTSLGLHQHRAGIRYELPEEITTVPERFRAAGYLTFCEKKEDYNFLRERDRLFSPEFERPAWRSHMEGRDVSWMPQLHDKQPFFGQIQLRGGKTGGETGARYPAKSRVAEEDVTVPTAYPDIPEVRNAIARHYEQVAETDAQVGAIVAGLKANGLWENTIVFFFTDHGVPLPRAKQFLYEDGLKVPLIVTGLGKNGVREDLVSGLDISVTSLALAGIAPDAHMEGRDLFAADYVPRTFVVGARDRCGVAVDRIRSIRTERFRYIKNYQLDRALYQFQYRQNYAIFKALREARGANALTPLQASYFDAAQRPLEELYDLGADPEQANNLAADPAFREVLHHHRQILQSWEAKTNDQGRFAESEEALRAVFKQYKGRCEAPEFGVFKRKK